MDTHSPIIVGPTVSNSSYTGTSFIKSGGTSAQFLMADGSVSSGGGIASGITITEHSTSDADFTPVWSSGTSLYITATKLKFNPFSGKISATSFFKIGGTSAQILTADGGIKVLGTGATDAAAGNHLHTGVYEPVFTKNTGFNKNFGTTAGTVSEGSHLHTGVYEPVFTKNTGFNKNFGTTAGTVSEGSHLHTGVYQPAGSYEPALGNPIGNGYILSSTTLGVRSWIANYTHPAYTTRSITATGAQVLSTFTSDAIGSVTAITTRTLTPANIGAEAALGNPGVSGYVLSSTTAGVRSWIVMSAGGATNLTTTHNTTTVVINSDTGTDATINGATNTTAGIVTIGAQVFEGIKTFGSGLVSSTVAGFTNSLSLTTSVNGTVYIRPYASLTTNESSFAISAAQIGTPLTVVGSTTATSFIKSGGTSAQYLMADGSVTTSSGGTPGGTTGQIQYNNAGAFGGFGAIGTYEIDFGKPIRLEDSASHANASGQGLITFGEFGRPEVVANVAGHYNVKVPFDGQRTNHYYGAGETANTNLSIYWNYGASAYFILGTSNITVTLSDIPNGGSGTLLVKQSTTARTLTIANNQTLTQVVIGSINAIQTVANSYNTITYKRFGTILTLVYGHDF